MAVQQISGTSDDEIATSKKALTIKKGSCSFNLLIKLPISRRRGEEDAKQNGKNAEAARALFNQAIAALTEQRRQTGRRGIDGGR